VTVDDDEIARAIAHAAQNVRQVVEGAGAAGVAALLSGKVALRPGSTVCTVLCGGNIDGNLLARVIEQVLVKQGRYILLRTTVDGLGVEPALPAQLRGAVHQLGEALGALAENGEAGTAEAVAGAARAGRLAAEGRHEPGTHALLVASIIETGVGDLYRVVGAEPH